MTRFTYCVLDRRELAPEVQAPILQGTVSYNILNRRIPDMSNGDDNRRCCS